VILIVVIGLCYVCIHCRRLVLEARICGGASSDAGDESEPDGPDDSDGNVSDSGSEAFSDFAARISKNRKIASNLKSDYTSGGDGVNQDVGSCAAMWDLSVLTSTLRETSMPVLAVKDR
jgi:hypothetical protein